MNEYRSTTNLNYGNGMTDVTVDSIHGSSRTTTGPSEVKQDGEHGVNELTRTDRSSLVIGDKFSTVRGSSNQYVGGDLIIRVDGRFSIISGNSDKNFDKQKEWYDATSDLAAARTAGEVKRGFYPIGQPEAIEKKEGTPATNPTLTSSFFSTNSIFGGINTDAKTGKSTASRSGTQSKMGVWATEQEAGKESPSTQGGTFAKNEVDIPALMVETQTKLTPIERELPQNDIPMVANNLVFATAGPPNTRPPGRIDPVGRQEVKSFNVYEKGMGTEYVGVPHIEEVDNHSDVPFGNIRYKAGNSFNVEVGNGGITLVTGGGIKLVGNSNTIVGGEQVLLAGKSNIRLQGGSFVGIKGANVDIQSGSPVTMNALGVQNSVAVGGAAYINGELFINHITAPKEIQKTKEEPEFTYGNPVAGKVIGTVTTSDGTYKVFGIATPDSIKVNKHTHLFENLPLTLGASNDAVRTAAAGMNNGSPIAASPATDAS